MFVNRDPPLHLRISANFLFASLVELGRYQYLESVSVFGIGISDVNLLILVILVLVHAQLG